MAESGRERQPPSPKVSRDRETAAGNVAAGAPRGSIDHLPDELLLRIFSLFSFNHLMEVQKVCVRWKRLAQDPSLWRNKEYVIRGSWLNGRSCCGVLCLECMHCRCEKKDEDIQRSVGTMPQLRTLTIMRDVTGSMLREICANCPNLTKLQIQYSQNIDCKFFLQVMKDIFEKCVKIETLRLGSSVLGSLECMEALPGLQRLTSLHVFDDKRQQGNIRLRLLADGCARLQEIHFSCRVNVLDGLDYFFNAKKGRLTSVSMHWTRTAILYQRSCVVVLLKKCAASLRKLRLISYDVPPDLEAEAFEALGELHNLQELHAERVRPFRPEMISLAFQPGRLTQLRRLLLPYASNLQDDTVVTISQGCPNLRELRLKFSQKITDASLSEIHKLKHLEILELSGCSGLGGAAVAFISQLPALHTLVLQHIKDLTKLQPGLKHILVLKELRRLDVLKSYNIGALPFHEFPGRLLKLRDLRVTYEGEQQLFYTKVFAKLQREMPQLKVFNTFWLTEDDFTSDWALGDDAYGDEFDDAHVDDDIDVNAYDDDDMGELMLSEN